MISYEEAIANAAAALEAANKNNNSERNMALRNMALSAYWVMIATELRHNRKG